MSFNYIPPAPEGAPKGEKRDWLRDKAKPVTPLSMRLRAGYGSLLSSTMNIRGLCSAGIKCIRKDGHAGPCWPTSSRSQGGE